MPEGELTRTLLTALAVKVSEYEAGSRRLLERARATTVSSEDRDAVLRDAAEITADLHHALRDLTNQVFQLQSDLLMQLVAKGAATPELE